MSELYRYLIFQRWDSGIELYRAVQVQDIELPFTLAGKSVRYKVDDEHNLYNE